MDKQLAKAIVYRMIRTICQTAVAAIGTSAMLSDVNWGLVVSTSLLAGLLSVLTSIATGLPEVKLERHLYQYHDEPEDSEVIEDEDE